MFSRSEGIRQHLESLRNETRFRAAVIIQSIWRGWHARKKWPALKCSLQLHQPVSSAGKNLLNIVEFFPSFATQIIFSIFIGHVMSSNLTSRAVSNIPPVNNLNNITHANNNNTCGSSGNAATLTRPRPQPIAGTPPPDPSEKCDSKVIQQTCSLFGLDLVIIVFIEFIFFCGTRVDSNHFILQERPPPVPPSRSYTVTGNKKFGYPQTRVMKMTFPGDYFVIILLFSMKNIFYIAFFLPFSRRSWCRCYFNER